MATASTDSDKALLTLDEAAEWLTARGVAVTRRGVNGWQRKGVVESLKIGGLRRIKLSSLQDLVENGTPQRAE